MLPSLALHLAEPTLRDTGYATQVELHDELRAIGQDPPVLDARELLLDPRAVLGELCRRLGLPFDAAMLHWKAGPRPEDGVWAPHWYDNVHRSTGFEPYRPTRAPAAAEPVASAARGVPPLLRAPARAAIQARARRWPRHVIASQASVIAARGAGRASS